MDNQKHDAILPQNSDLKAAIEMINDEPPEVEAAGIGENCSPSHEACNLLKRFLACNPLYLSSAALLLYSVYLISKDQAFLRGETQQLTFNLCSLQVYEILLVVTAIFLAIRSVWYDATLLVGLENLFVLVPFILISQAALIEAKLVWTLSSAAGLLAMARVQVLKRSIKRLNFPPLLVAVGIAMIAVNGALPIIYRILHESKVGTRPDFGAAYETNQYIWWLLVPAACALISIVPCSRTKPGQPWPEQPWLPAGLFGLWLVGTCVHLYCLGYVYDFALRPELVAPSLWIISWAIAFRLTRSLAELPALGRSGLLVIPALSTLLATTQPEKGVFLVLTSLNVAVYGRLYFSWKQAVPLHLALISMIGLVGGLPLNWMHFMTPQSSPGELLLGGCLVYALGWIGWTRNPKLAVLGALLTGISMGSILNRADAAHWAFQTGVIFLLLHSLRWNDSVEPGSRSLRWTAALIWVGHSLVWTHFYGAGWKACLTGFGVLGVCLLARWLQKRWAVRLLPIAAVLVCFSVPSHSAAVQIGSTPSGLVALIASFLLFGLGTIGALLKHRWQALETRSASTIRGTDLSG